jgi:hypothetical protein
MSAGKIPKSLTVTNSSFYCPYSKRHCSQGCSRVFDLFKILLPDQTPSCSWFRALGTKPKRPPIGLLNWVVTHAGDM